MGVENIFINKDRMVTVIQTCLDARAQGVGVYEGQLSPETEYIDLLKSESERIGDPRFPLNALFLSTSMLFAEDTEKQFKKISDEERLREYSWIFRPEDVIDSDNLDEAVKKFFRPGGYSTNSINQWRYNCEVLINSHNGDIRNFFDANDNNAISIVDSLVVKPRKKNKEGFRRFGPKLARYLVQLVELSRLYTLEDVDKIGIQVDFNVARILRQTEAVYFEGPEIVHNVNEKILTPAITELCKEKGWVPRQVSEALYVLGNKGCNPREHELCPVGNFCKMRISRKPYDKSGLIDPVNVEKVIFESPKTSSD